MLYFSHRKKLERLYKAWCEENGILDCPVSLISFLQVKGLLNQEKALKLIDDSAKNTTAFMKGVDIL